MTQDGYSHAAIMDALKPIEALALMRALDLNHPKVGHTLPPALKIDGVHIEVPRTIFAERVYLATNGLLTPLGYDIALELKERML